MIVSGVYERALTAARGDSDRTELCCFVQSTYFVEKFQKTLSVCHRAIDVSERSLKTYTFKVYTNISCVFCSGAISSIDLAVCLKSGNFVVYFVK